MSLVVFAADPDWSEPIRERPEYLTDILPSHDQHEQRIRLRRRPRTRLTFRLLEIDRRDSATVAALIYGSQGQQMGVPFWPDAKPLLAAAVATDTNIELETAYRRFAAGGLVLLWRDLRTYEYVEIDTVNVDSLDLAAPLTMDWPADGRTYAIPLLKGRLTDSVPINFLTNSFSDLTVAFECEDSELGEGDPGDGAGPPDAPELHECAP